MIDNVWYSRLFNVHAWSEHKAVMDLTEHVFQSLTADQQAAVIGKSNNKGTTDLYRVLRVILVDQYVSWKMDPEFCTALSRGRNQWIVGSRYNGLHLPYRTLEVIDMLVGRNRCLWSVLRIAPALNVAIWLVVLTKTGSCVKSSFDLRHRGNCRRYLAAKVVFARRA